MTQENVPAAADNDFDYKAFALNLKLQVRDLIPKDISIYERDNIVYVVEKFALTAGDALTRDSSVNLTVEQQETLVQIIAEWTFHKTIDLIRSDIPIEYREQVLRKIADSLYEVIQQCFAQNMPQEYMIDAVEQNVQKKYTEAIEEMLNSGIITEFKYKTALNQSNIDKMAQEEAVKKQQNTSRDILIGVIALILLVVGLSAKFIKITKRVDKIKSNKTVEHTLKTDSASTSEADISSSGSSQYRTFDELIAQKQYLNAVSIEQFINDINRNLDMSVTNPGTDSKSDIQYLNTKKSQFLEMAIEKGDASYNKKDFDKAKEFYQIVIKHGRDDLLDKNQFEKVNTRYKKI